MIDKTKIEQLLVKKWSEFLDFKKLMSKVLYLISATTFSIVTKDKLPERNSVQIGLSNLKLASDGLVIWVDFFVPKDNAADVGTIECLICWDGELIPLNVVGNTIVKASASP